MARSRFVEEPVDTPRPPSRSIKRFCQSYSAPGSSRSIHVANLAVEPDSHPSAAPWRPGWSGTTCTCRRLRQKHGSAVRRSRLAGSLRPRRSLCLYHVPRSNHFQATSLRHWILRLIRVQENRGRFTRRGAVGLPAHRLHMSASVLPDDSEQLDTGHPVPVRRATLGTGVLLAVPHDRHCAAACRSSGAYSVSRAFRGRCARR